MKRDQAPLFELLAQAEQRRASVRDAQREGTEDARRITSHEIRARRFGRRLLWGLQPDDVTAFLDEVADSMDAAHKLNLEMGTQLRLLQEEVLTSASSSPPDSGRQGDVPGTSNADAEGNDAPAGRRLDALRATALQEVEALLHDAQSRAQALCEAASQRADAIVREAEMLKAQSEREADDAIARARATAESIVAAARDEEAAVRQEIERLRERRFTLFDELRATLDLCDEWLATVDPRRRAPGADGPRAERPNQDSAVEAPGNRAE